MHLYHPQTVLDHEASAAQASDLSLWQLMQKAAQAIFNELQTRYHQRRHWLVLAGTGNNGGDAYLVAKLALSHGYTVTLCALDTPKTELGQQAKQIFVRAGGQVTAELPNTVDLILDGLFGAGFRGELEGRALAWVRQANAMAAAKIAIDVPSGVDSATGWVVGDAFEADFVVQLVAAKQGLYTSKACDYCGDKVVKRLGIDLGVTADARLLTQLQLPRRPQYFNKGSAGHVKVIGAGIGMAGAGYLTALAALRSGAGKVTIYCAEQNVSTIASMLPEAMVLPMTKFSSQPQDVLAIGPGLGRDEWAGQVAQHVLASSGRKIVDADGLHWLTPQIKDIDVITPHPGEASRMLGITTLAAEKDRFATLAALATRAQQVVLKGNGSLVWDGQVNVIGLGSPAMAAPGMGDVLTGIIAGLMAQNIPNAAATGALWHALAGDLEIGVLASDVANRLPLVRASHQY